MFIPELLAPAGNPDKLRACLLYGADAVYLGGASGNLRAACEGFTEAELGAAVLQANALGARVYYCLNSLPMQDDLPSLPPAIESAAGAGVHGFIIADPGVLRLARRYAPGVPVHLSTQANTGNSAAVEFWADQSVSRVNLARELSARDIYAVRKACPDMELEVFVHGAMCLAVSGQCLLSAWLNSRSGNQGRCTQPCRFEYRALDVETLPDGVFAANKALVVEEYTRPGEPLWRVEQGERHSSFWAPQDLCLLPWLSWFCRNRIDALKIEGRMKSSGWLAHVVDAYRTALDAMADVPSEGPGGERDAGETGGRHTAHSAGERRGRRTRAECLTETLYAATRPLGSGFFLHGKRRNLTRELLDLGGLGTRPNRSGEAALPELGHPLLARVLEPAGLGVWKVEAHGNWRRSMDVELMLPGLKRPVLVGGSYGLENQRGDLSDLLGNGNRGLLYSDLPGIVPGIFIRGAE